MTKEDRKTMAEMYMNMQSIVCTNIDCLFIDMIYCRHNEHLCIPCQKECPWYTKGSDTCK